LGGGVRCEQISWIRQRDLAILVSGADVVTSDARISATHPVSSDLWGLQVCQSSRHPIENQPNPS